MPDLRTIILRHGETEWSLNGKHTSVTDLPLTENGKKRIRATGRAMVGPDRLICPTLLVKVYVSPRRRAQDTFRLIFESVPERERAKIEVVECEDIREWDYGNYEGMTTPEINALRKSQGLDKNRPWSIWEDGCEGGESPDQVTHRLDSLICRIKDDHDKARRQNQHYDVLVVAHGHILRCFAQRWIERPITENPNMILEAGGIGVLGYEHGRRDEPALYLGGAFIVPAELAPCPADM